MNRKTNGACGRARNFPRLGVVGGLAPRASARFYSLLCEKYLEMTGGAYPDVVMRSIPLQRQQVDAFATGAFQSGDESALGKLVRRACRSLQTGGAKVIAIPSDVVNWNLPSATVPRIGLVEATCLQVHRRGAHRVALFASAATVSSRVYQTVLTDAGIAVVTPSARDQEVVDQFISAMLSWHTATHDTAAFLRVVAKLTDEVDAVVLGCADLCEAIDTVMVGKPVIDGLPSLVDECCRLLLGPGDDETCGTALYGTSMRKPPAAPKNSRKLSNRRVRQLRRQGNPNHGWCVLPPVVGSAEALRPHREMRASKVVHSPDPNADTMPSLYGTGDSAWALSALGEPAAYADPVVGDLDRMPDEVPPVAHRPSRGKAALAAALAFALSLGAVCAVAALQLIDFHEVEANHPSEPVPVVMASAATHLHGDHITDLGDLLTW